MIRKLPSTQADCVRVVFELPACIWADRIFLVGDFNEWNTTITPFSQGRDGVWRASVDLPLGREYQFRYLVDGNWQTDFHADGWVANEFGSQNSIVRATLPPDAPPTAGPTSLLHEGLRELSRSAGASPSLPPGPSASVEGSHRFFPPRTRAAG